MIMMPDLIQNEFVGFIANIKRIAYDMTVRWNPANECAYLSVDLNGQNIYQDVPLVCGGVIRSDNRKIPPMVFIHKDSLLFRPTKETFNQYGLIYAD